MKILPFTSIYACIDIRSWPCCCSSGSMSAQDGHAEYTFMFLFVYRLCVVSYKCQQEGRPKTVAFQFVSSKGSIWTKVLLAFLCLTLLGLPLLLHAFFAFLPSTGVHVLCYCVMHACIYIHCWDARRYAATVTVIAAGSDNGLFSIYMQMGGSGYACRLS